MTSFRVVLAVGLGLLPAALPGRLYAWGGLGHRTVAIIAEHRLSARALEEVRLILGPKTSLADISTCADDIKRRPIKCGSFTLNADHRSSRWHYVDIPINAQPTASTVRSYCRGHGRDDQCSTEQIKKEIAVLQDPKADVRAKQIALMFLVHLMGDLHQPLHNADDGDSGGNAKLVRFMASPRARKKTNLHHIWDNMLMKDSEAKKWRPAELAAELERDMARKNTASWISREIVDSSALESFRIAQSRIYRAYALKDGGDLGRTYQAEMQPIAFEQVEKAGVRLAHILNQAWPKGSPAPITAISVE